jgi:hypothetical protein
MFIDTTGRVGTERALEMRRQAKALGFGRTGRRHHVRRDSVPRTELDPTSDHRSR